MLKIAASDSVCTMSKSSTGDVRILIVDDEPMIRALFGELLTEEDCAVMAVATLSEARGALASHRFDLVIADQHLPDGRGTDLLHILQQAATKLVIISGAEANDTLGDARDGAVIERWQKPFDDIDEIVGRVRRVLAGQDS